MHALVMHLERLSTDRRCPETVEAARKDVIRTLELMEAQLERSPYFTGGAFSIGDIPLGISTQRFFHFKLERPPTPCVESWLARLSQREGFRKHVAPRDKHLRSE